MKLDLNSGRYIVAVSGGVDSMVLLDLLSKYPGLELIVAHLDHGIREDSLEDKILVEGAAAKYGLIFETKRINLGSSASEAVAREARYEFLENAKNKYTASAIITAHHQDDMLETAIINMLRGGGRKGLTSLSSSATLVRPLLRYTKKEIVDYANKNNIIWRDDSTNTDINYLRNYVRRNLLPKFSDKDKSSLLSNIQNLGEVNKNLDELLLTNIKRHATDGGIQRIWFNSLPHKVACEVLASWLRENNVREFDRNLIEKLVVNLKVSKQGRKLDVRKNVIIEITKEDLNLTTVKR